jgi:S-DNA-T family DNA segregation ATPase FtsK/SpoIIIE
MGYEVGAHVIVARSAAGVATPEPLMRGLHDAGGATLLLSRLPEDGEVLDGVEPRAVPTGRGRYLSGGEEFVVQTALAGELG